MSSASTPPSEITYAWGTIDEALALGFADLLEENWLEIETDHDKVPLSINWPAYRALQRDKIVRLMLVKKNGELVGYSNYFVQPTLHHRHSLWAINDLIWLTPAHRRGWTGITMIRTAESLLREEGVQQVIYSAKVAFDKRDPRATVARLLARLGYSRVEETWAKFL